ncbi:DUF6639 family protein [Hydrogenophaga sp.]|uniref:DUF6639 family protein n=1 Tax=Hydrogenophaga sp. TaxID=1904254 RepID=UPI0027289FF6|nr:DUF6639 family protein [Hydrogenophaga sp.]MDO9132309.1 hypothetical protein [Hydrogenophaga sp.]
MTSESRPCPDANAFVAGAGAQDFGDICQGMASALAFFAAHGLTATEALSVTVTRQLPSEAGATAAGCFLEKQRMIYVAPFTEFRKNTSWFGVPIDRAMYRSLATHEAAHAIASCNFSIPNPTIQAKEYLAYVAMFSSMPTALRQKALAGMPVESFDSFDRFTPLLYMFDPMRFGAGACRHFSALPEPASVIRAVLTGKALTD